jgi:large subunit ribosomal protein L22
MESRALTRYIGSSPRKMRLVVDLIRNRNVDEALAILKYTNKNAAKVVEKTLLSAYSNLVRKIDTGRINKDEVIVKRAFVNEGPSLKRMLPAPQGRAFRIRKRSSHLTLVVEHLENKS